MGHAEGKERRIVTPMTASTPPTPEAGWYPDPDSPGRQRYWTGSKWGPQVAPDATASGAGGEVLSWGHWLGIFLFPILGLAWGIPRLRSNPPLGAQLLVVTVVALFVDWWLLSLLRQ